MDAKSRTSIKDRDVVAILRNDFLEGASFPADIYARISADKYIMLARQGDKANFNALMVNMTLDHLYVLREDYNKLVGQNLSIAGILINQNEISDDKKAAFLSKAAESVFVELAQLGISREAIEHARSVAKNIKILVESKSDFLSMMKLLANLPGGQIHRAIAVSAVSVMVGRQMGWTVPSTLEKLAMGGLLIDVGLKEMPRELIEKPRHEHTTEERLVYETHPFRGAEILRSMPSASDELISIVYEHHENANGLGYPRRLRDIRMNPLAKVVCMADTFCDLTIKNTNNPNVKSPAEALAFIDQTLGQPFNKHVFQALKQLMGLPVDSRNSAVS